MVLQIRDGRIVTVVNGTVDQVITSYNGFRKIAEVALVHDEPILLGSDFDFPEEATDDPAVIKLAEQIRSPHCPGCNGPSVLSDDPQVMRCEACGGVFTPYSGNMALAGPIHVDQAMPFVNFRAPMLANAGPAGSFYFDFMVIGDTNAPARRAHGWADKATKRVVQWG